MAQKTTTSMFAFTQRRADWTCGGSCFAITDPLQRLRLRKIQADKIMRLPRSAVERLQCLLQLLRIAGGEGNTCAPAGERLRRSQPDALAAAADEGIFSE
jgi:hypothetical protein